MKPDRSYLAALGAMARATTRGSWQPPLGGIKSTGGVKAAKLFIGRGIDSLKFLALDPYAGGRRTPSGFGAALEMAEIKRGEMRARTVSREALRIRTLQIGAGIAGATLTLVRGVFEGGSERSVTLEIIFQPSNREKTYTAFKKHVGALAEEMALTLAQKTILVQFNDGGKLSGAEASPKGLPAPGKRLDDAIDKLRGRSRVKP